MGLADNLIGLVICFFFAGGILFHLAFITGDVSYRTTGLIIVAVPVGIVIGTIFFLLYHDYKTRGRA